MRSITAVSRLLGRRLSDALRHYAVVSAIANGEEGQTLMEYALILSLVSIVAIAALTLIGTDVLGLIQQAVDAFP